MHTTSPFRVLFVCLGNICRSPAAEIIFQSCVSEAGLSHLIQTDSCGTASYHTNSKPDPRMLAALNRAGFTYTGHRARSFSQADFSRFDLILPQDTNNAADLLNIARTSSEKAKVRGIWHYFPTSEVEEGVPDPYYGDSSSFDYVVSLLQRSMPALLADICHRINIDRK